MNYNTYTLHNGLRIIHLPSVSQVVYCGYAIGSGTRHETDDEYGLAHFCEHMTFKGTARLSSLQVINSLERLGGDLNAFTTKQDTFYYAAILREYFTKAVDLLTEIVFHSTYPQSEIDKEVEVICDEIESYNDTPADLIYDEFENAVFAGTSLGHNILGTSDRVRSFRTEDALRFTQRHYVPSNAVFYVVGNIDFNALVARLKRLFPETPSSLIPNPSSLIQNTPSSLIPNPSSKIIINYDTHQTHVMLGTVITEEIEEKRIPLFLLNNIIGGPSMNSRLNLSLRERRGLVYSVDSSMTTYADALLWTIYFGCDPHDTKRCLRLIRTELERLGRTPLSPTALRQAKQQLRGQLALASENKENYAIDMAKQFLHRGTLKDNDRLFSQIDAVTSEQLQHIARYFIAPDCLTTMIMK